LKIVSNTTPIITLLRISKLDLLKEVCGEIIIPYGVYEEIEIGKEKYYYSDLKKYKWIEIIKLEKTNELNLDLDKGELETILLAKEINADLIIMDEKLGRRYAKYYGLNVIGTIGIIMKAREKGIIEDIETVLSDIKKSGIWINDKLIADILKKQNN